MCLYFKSQDTREIAYRLNKNGNITGYKFLKRQTNRFEYYKYQLSSIYFSKIWLPGWNRSNKGETKNNRLCGKLCFNRTVSLGIHVFTNKMKNNRENILRSMVFGGKERKDIIIVPVTCYKKDFVAAGSWDGLSIRSAVFTKVFLKKEDYNKALKGESNI